MRRMIILSFIFTILMTSAVYAGGTYAGVTGNRVNVRSYSEICPSNRLFQVNRGYVVEVHGIAGDFFSATISGEDGVFISREFTRITQTRGTVTAPFTWVYY